MSLSRRQFLKLSAEATAVTMVEGVLGRAAPSPKAIGQSERTSDPHAVSSKMTEGARRP